MAYIKPTREMIEHAVAEGWSYEDAERGYAIFDFDCTGMLEIEAIGAVYCFDWCASGYDDEACAHEAEHSGFCKIIPVDELPENMYYEDHNRRWFGWVDTLENRRRISEFFADQNHVKEEKRMLREIIETCPHCDAENNFEWDVERNGYLATCQECGNPLFLCDECLHADGEFSDDCNWHHELGGDGKLYSACKRGRYLDPDQSENLINRLREKSKKEVSMSRPKPIYTLEIAREIVELFEDLLDKHGIMIPDDDREGLDGEACLYGTTYWDLLGDVDSILVDVMNECGTEAPIIPGEWAH